MLGLKKQHTISPIFKIGILIRVEKYVFSQYV